MYRIFATSSSLQRLTLAKGQKQQPAGFDVKDPNLTARASCQLYPSHLFLITYIILILYKTIYLKHIISKLLFDGGTMHFAI